MTLSGHRQNTQNSAAIAKAAAALKGAAVITGFAGPAGVCVGVGALDESPGGTDLAVGRGGVVEAVDFLGSGLGVDSGYAGCIAGGDGPF